MLRSVFAILSGNASASLMSFGRNLLIARLLSVEDYGIAVTFALSMSLVEMTSEIGLQQLIVQSREGDDPDFQAGLQGFHLLRSIGAALVLFLLAGPIAAFLAVPAHSWVYQMLALVPLVRGFEHFDMHRLTRAGNYRAVLMYRSLPMAVSLAAVWPLAWLLEDYRVMLYALIVQHVCGLIVSHVLAKRSYRLRIDGRLISSALSFGWPLLVSNALLFGVMQGDRVIVAHELGLQTLAVFSMGITMTMTPINVLAQSMSLFFLPKLSKMRNQDSRFTPVAHAAIHAGHLAGLLLILLVMLFGGPAVHLLLGEKYAALVPLLFWFAVAQALRGFRVGVVQTALACAATRVPMLANVVRTAVLPVAWYAAASGASTTEIIWIAIAGEFGAYVTALGLLRFRVGISFQGMWAPIAAVMLCLWAYVGAALFAERLALPGMVLQAVFLLLFVAVAASMKRSLSSIRDALRRPRNSN